MKRSRFAMLVIAMMIMAMIATCACARVIYVKTDGNDMNIGLSWELAKQTFSGAFGAAVAGDEIWVAAGTYTRTGTIPAGVGVYGGFAGTETLRSQRNWSQNVTTAGGSYYFFINDTNGSTVFDGFTVSGGTYYFGAGIIAYGNPTISHCKFVDNHAQYNGGAIACNNGAAKIVNNHFFSNSAGADGGAVHCGNTSAPIITNNFFQANTANRGGGVFMAAGSAPIISNNRLEVNSYGALYADTGALPVLHHNGYYNFGYGGPIYVGLEPGEGDFGYFLDFADGAHNPMVDKGWNDAPGIPALDLKGQPRVCGTIDVGPDEALVVYVSGTADAFGGLGNDSNSGMSWSQAKRTIQGAINSVTAPAWIQVKHGTYVENLTLPSGVTLEGGFVGYGDVQNFRKYPTYIDGNYQGPVISIIPTTPDLWSRIYGFRIVHGYSSDLETGGAIEANGCSPYIQCNTFRDNSCNGIMVTSDPDKRMLIDSNLIWMSSGNGIKLSGCVSNSDIINNTVVGTNLSGIKMVNDSHPLMQNNLVVTSVGYGIEVDATSSPSNMYNNDVWGNSDNYSDWFDNNPSVIATDISADPKLRYNSDYPDELHITSDSPCFRAGREWDGIFAWPTDIDCQPRSTVFDTDIGADQCHVVFVNPYGSSENDGNSWSYPKASIQGAVDGIATDIGTSKFYADPIEVWVKEGTYTGITSVPCEAQIFGGFEGDETAKSQRNWNLAESILNGNQLGSTIVLQKNGSVLDGFTVTNALPSNADTGGFVVLDGCTATVTHNKIHDGSGCAVRAWGSTSQTPSTIQNNIIYNICGAGVRVEGYAPDMRLVNNTINNAAYGIQCVDGAHPRIANNIVANCYYGVQVFGDSQPNTLFVNCLYQNAGNYVNVDPLISGFDIYVNPLFVNLSAGDLHLTSTSPCIGAGSTEYMASDDYDGTTRVSPPDIGADEYNQ